MASNDPFSDLLTLAVHAGESRAVPNGLPTVTPVYASATFTYDSMADMDRAFSGEIAGYVYTRHGNPTVAAVERTLQALEGGAGACAFGSGMAALHAALVACELRPGSTVLASQDLYGATLSLLLKIFSMFGVNTVLTDFADTEQLAAKAREVRPRVLVAETISNPLLKVCDLDACSAIAKEAGARFVVDSTFATPCLTRPLEHGADFVVHSATKYLSGHATVTGGIVVSKQPQDHDAVYQVMKLVGGILGPWEAHEVSRGIKTLPLRFERQCTNARKIAETLAKDGRVKRVYYPALCESPERLARILKPEYAGALVSFVLADDTREAAFRFMDALKLCVRATSLGDVFSTALHPATASHRDVPPARRQKLGVTDGLVRISAGIENVADILADIDQALGAAAGS
jgi:cystathionine beta-lyase/cystathionine gamma-synthase